MYLQHDNKSGVKNCQICDYYINGTWDKIIGIRPIVSAKPCIQKQLLWSDQDLGCSDLDTVKGLTDRKHSELNCGKKKLFYSIYFNADLNQLKSQVVETGWDLFFFLFVINIMIDSESWRRQDNSSRLYQSTASHWTASCCLTLVSLKCALNGWGQAKKRRQKLNLRNSCGMHPLSF